ncbi:hypothetical protein LOC59_04000 [Arthrobacter sp. zg-Y916]|uniref:Uncharacterized protein n=1 Tax=Arthrobacter caoxuetaonis TaxID=2886935 RepID=A0A9X1SBP9_9MICC|nr:MULTISPECIES: hypothetical protein [Arthrobacter]MCC3296726.1 hypothetical protein [Arthrobacter caoxuetaonis]MCC9192816.1 hypothetical protein [Arthrobacter sp. zg-Y916]USQ56453.1 hypothetical protein NF551_11920 [Arthrobacter caoxuetaonis]
MNRALAVARMQLLNKWIYLGIPAIILVTSTVISIAILAMIPSDGEGTRMAFSGQSVMWYFLAIGVQALTYTFPFSQALSVSRRSFYIGTLGLFALASLALGVLYWVLGLVEDATNGWGVGGNIFALPWIAESAWYTQILLYFALSMLLFMFGFWFATVYKRWRATGLVAALVGFALLLLGSVAAVSFTDSWAEVGAWFVQLTPLALAGWLLLAGVVLAAGSYGTLRRATP